MPAGEQMNVQVGDALGGIRAIVHDKAKSALEAEFLRELPRDGEEMPHMGFIGGLEGFDPRYQLFGDDEQMDGGLRLDVVDGDAEIVLVLDPRRNLPIDDALKDRLLRGGHG